MRKQFDPALLKQAALLTAIPFVLLVGPALGFWLGSALDRRWAYAPWGVALGCLLGLAASGRVTADYIRQAQTLTKKHDDTDATR